MIRKVLLERGFDERLAVNKMSEYCVDLRNLTGYSFVHIVHLNRNMADIQRQKAFGDRIYPMPEDIKSTGSLSEDANHIFTIFNPNDSRYNLDKHFGRQIKDSSGDELYPGLRTIHLVESRHVEYPQHFATVMDGGTKMFKQIKFE